MPHYGCHVIVQISKQKRPTGFKKAGFTHNSNNLQHTRKQLTFIKEYYLVYLFFDQKNKKQFQATV